MDKTTYYLGRFFDGLISDYEKARAEFDLEKMREINNKLISVAVTKTKTHLSQIKKG